MFDRITLPGGLRIIGEKIPHVRSVSVGLWLGALLFVLLTVGSNDYVLNIDVVGDAGYESAVMEILGKYDVSLFERYDGSKTDVLTAEILRLRGVSFCSVRKIGSTIVVEVRTSSFAGE